MIRRLREYFDLKTFLLALALVGIGLVSVYSATFDARASEYFHRQLLWAAFGLLAMCVAAFLPLRLLQLASVPAYMLSIAFLLAVLLLGRTVSGSTSWFSVGQLRFQPSEMAKVTTALMLASYLARMDVSLRRPRDLGIAAGIVLLPLALIMLQPDTGTGLIFVGMLLPVLYWGGASRSTLVMIVAPAAAAVAALFGTTPFLIAVAVFGVLIYLTREQRLVAAAAFCVMILVGISVQSIHDGLKPYQQRRIAAFLNPNADPLGAGYNIVQSKVAIGSGGLLGKGYLRGTQTQLNFIPEQWTDFIFCVPGEEFGFAGAATVLLLFAGLIFRGVALAAAVKSQYLSVLGIALTGLLFTHVVVNVGMAVGLLPVIGVPLPFLSYGGSSLLASMTMVGLFMNLYANRKEY
jgi:rod shape determining protein RodA